VKVYETPQLISQMRRTPGLKQCHVTGLRRRFYTRERDDGKSFKQTLLH